MKRLILFSIIFLIITLANGLPSPHESSSHDDHDDSDMWMEADELPPPEYSVVRSESRVVRQYSSSPDKNEATSISRVENFKPEVVVHSTSSDPTNPTTAEQNFFPSYLTGLPLPFKIASTHAASIAGRYNAGRSQLFDHSILGSGDFSILHGGTFYPEEPSRYQAKSDELLDPVYTNGHGKPVAEALTAKKELHIPEDPFENFKDFADMNAGSDSPAFSHFVVIYANKNSTKPHPHPSPKNIFEQLQLLDQEKERDSVVEDEAIDEKKLMKLSKYKTKLSKTKVVKKYKKKLGPKYEQASPDYTDPLLATS
ncbi:hypothetical protein PVAND_012204 [Polypedilum vanderplanki]|uniref:Uncharacterized protein n=1 Tax=Polypedilum vanderplanki TaxID=319348 RepID=A0A9J6CMP4_POLVA|nr:hypothetical protein PVAND_012204 [Polypedilum vanderplanki]